MCERRLRQRRDPGPLRHAGAEAGTAGLETVRDAGVGTESPEHSSHSYLRCSGVRVPADHLLGGAGQAFAIAQTRLGGGRIHHAMGAVTRHGRLADMQATQEKLADSWIEIEQFRLLVLRTAWLIDRHQDYRAVRKDIAAVKVAMPRVYHDVVRRAMQLHGALGISNEMPFSAMMVDAQVMAIADGPTEVHQQTLARQLLRDVTPGEPLFGSGHLPTLTEAARRHVAARLEHEVALH